MYRYMMQNWGNNWACPGYGYYGLGSILDILIWILIIVIIVFVIKRIVMKNMGGVFGKSSLDILKERYAKGEISKEEFEKIKQDLER